MKLDLEICSRIYHVIFMQQSFDKSIKMKMFCVKPTIGCMKHKLRPLNELVVVICVNYDHDVLMKNI